MKKAFTLIELLVVVLIIGILASIALPQYGRAVERARAAEALQNVGALQRAVDIYLLENGYPSTFIEFFGTTGQSILVTDMVTGLDCEQSSDSCQNEHFRYSSHCDSGACVVSVLRRAEDEMEDGYSLHFIKSKSTGAWTKRCDYGETKEWLCKGLEPLGYTRNSCC